MGFNPSTFKAERPDWQRALAATRALLPDSYARNTNHEGNNKLLYHMVTQKSKPIYQR